jgi:F420-non-reducing hydrogenase large subunit
MKRISIDPITRLEGHGRIEIFLNDDDEVADVAFQVPELRGFEKFCQGRPVWELASIVPRICGVCPGAHHMAAGKAIDAVYQVEPPETARKLRELFYCAHFIHSHIAHFYLLAAPDFVVGPDAERSQRNVLGMLQKVGLELVGSVIEHRKLAEEIQATLAGRATHPSWTVPGGVSKGLQEPERRQIADHARACLEFAKATVKVFEEVVLADKAHVDLICSDPYQLRTHYMGLVDDQNRVAFYDGQVRVVDTEGREIVKYPPSEYLAHVGEHVEPWSYLKFPFLKAKGWRGLVEGQDSGVYQAAPLARLNAATGMALRWPRPSTSGSSRRWAAGRCAPRSLRTGLVSSSSSTPPSAWRSSQATRSSPAPRSAVCPSDRPTRVWGPWRRRAERSRITT